MNRAPPLAVPLFLPPVLSNLSSRIRLTSSTRAPGALNQLLANRFPARSALVACALEPPAECKGKCYTETFQSTEIHPQREFFPQIILDFPSD